MWPLCVAWLPHSVGADPNGSISGGPGSSCPLRPRKPQCQLCTDISQLCSTGGSRDPTSDGSCGDTLVRRAHRARLVV